MALTVVVLFTALLFMGFSSIYIRHFSEDDPTAHLSRRRRFRAGPLDMFSLSSESDPPHGSNPRKGLDPATYSYHANAKYQVDCAICLSEFEDGECVKIIPNCKHVFHVECIDEWLASHLTCPVCRGSRLFDTKGDSELGSGVIQETADQGASQSSTVDIGETCIMMGTASTPRERRTSSRSSLGQPAMQDIEFFILTT